MSHFYFQSILPNYLNMCHLLHSTPGYFSLSSKLAQPIYSWLTADTVCPSLTLTMTSDHLTSNVCRVLAVMWSNSVSNFSKTEQQRYCNLNMSILDLTGSGFQQFCSPQKARGNTMSNFNTITQCMPELLTISQIFLVHFSEGGTIS